MSTGVVTADNNIETVTPSIIAIATDCGGVILTRCKCSGSIPENGRFGPADTAPANDHFGILRMNAPTHLLYIRRIASEKNR